MAATAESATPPSSPGLAQHALQELFTTEATMNRRVTAMAAAIRACNMEDSGLPAHKQQCLDNLAHYFTETGKAYALFTDALSTIRRSGEISGTRDDLSGEAQTAMLDEKTIQQFLAWLKDTMKADDNAFEQHILYCGAATLQCTYFMALFDPASDSENKRFMVRLNKEYSKQIQKHGGDAQDAMQCFLFVIAEPFQRVLRYPMLFRNIQKGLTNTMHSESILLKLDSFSKILNELPDHMKDWADVQDPKQQSALLRVIGLHVKQAFSQTISDLPMVSEEALSGSDQQPQGPFEAHGQALLESLRNAQTCLSSASGEEREIIGESPTEEKDTLQPLQDLITQFLSKKTVSTGSAFARWFESNTISRDLSDAIRKFQNLLAQKPASGMLTEPEKALLRAGEFGRTLRTYVQNTEIRNSANVTITTVSELIAHVEERQQNMSNIISHVTLSPGS